MHNLDSADPIYENSKLIGYVLKLKEGVWVPLDSNGDTYSSPSSEKDARDIVKILSEQDKKMSLVEPKF